MARSITGTIGLAATLVFALPVGIFGLRRLLSGSTFIGIGALAVAALMILLGEYVTTPMDAPGVALGRVVETVAVDPDEDEE